MLDINPDMLNRIADILNEVSYEVYSDISEIRSITEDISEAWISEYTNTYVQCSEEILKGMTDTSEKIKELSEQLKGISDMVTETEQTLADEIMN